jgi:hypothetical protein
VALMRRPQIAAGGSSGAKHRSKRARCADRLTSYDGYYVVDGWLASHTPTPSGPGESQVSNRAEDSETRIFMQPPRNLWISEALVGGPEAPDRSIRRIYPASRIWTSEKSSSTTFGE